MHWKLKDLFEFANGTRKEVNGKWIPARPIRLDGFAGVKLRLKLAWRVFTGKVDTVEWPEGQ